MIKRYPPAKSAADIIANDYGYGKTISNERLEDILELSDTGETMTREEHKRLAWIQLASMDALRKELLEHYRMMLVNTVDGYRVALPEEQTKRSIVDFQSSIRSATKKARSRLVYINREMLDENQRRENQEAISKLDLIDKSNRKALGFSHSK